MSMPGLPYGVQSKPKKRKMPSYHYFDVCPCTTISTPCTTCRTFARSLTYVANVSVNFVHMWHNLAESFVNFCRNSE